VRSSVDTYCEEHSRGTFTGAMASALKCDYPALLEAMSLAREAIDHVQELLDWCEVRELPVLDDGPDTHDTTESREGE
jgi:hypothetical protein